MALTGAERVERHRQKQRGRIGDLEAEIERLKRRTVKIQPPTPSKRRLKEAMSNWENGGYGPSLLANNRDQSFDSFVGGVAVAIAVIESGKSWAYALDSSKFETAINLLLADMDSTGELSQYHAGAVSGLHSYFGDQSAPKAPPTPSPAPTITTNSITRARRAPEGLAEMMELTETPEYTAWRVAKDRATAIGAGAAGDSRKRCERRPGGRTGGTGGL